MTLPSSSISLFDKLNITVTNIKGRYSPGKALNLGARLASHDVLLVLSAHSQITKVDLNYISTNLVMNKAIFGKQIHFLLKLSKGKKSMVSSFLTDINR